MMLDATESVGVLVAGAVANPIPVSVIAATIAEYCCCNAVVAAVIHGQGTAR